MSSEKIISKIEKLSPLERHEVISHFFKEYPFEEKAKIFCCFYCGKFGSVIFDDCHNYWYGDCFSLKDGREICRSCLNKQKFQ